MDTYIRTYICVCTHASMHVLSEGRGPPAPGRAERLQRHGHRGAAAAGPAASGGSRQGPKRGAMSQCAKVCRYRFRYRYRKMCVRLWMYVYVYTYVLCVYVYMCASLYMYIYICMYMYIYICSPPYDTQKCTCCPFIRKSY